MAKKNTKTGKELERQVADAYRAMGARRVEHDVELAGHQIDVYVEMETADRALHRIAVEAKEYSDTVGIGIVRDFSEVVSGLRRLGKVDEGVIVSTSGFSRQARNRAQEEGLRLLEPADLVAMAARPSAGGRTQAPCGGADATLPGERAPLGRAPGSPFVPGRPLRADEPIYGRDEVLRLLAGQLATFGSANVVGERRIGKTSVLTHLVEHQEQLLTRQPDQPPLVLACLDLQAGVTSDTGFYGAALREILDRLPPGRSPEASDLQEWRARLYAHPEMEYNEFHGVLKRLRDVRGVCVRPVLIVDEFERLLGAEAQEEFPIPYFFDGLRALITAKLLAMVVASQHSLADYFRNSEQPGILTSSFPTYFMPFTLSLLDDAASDQLLLQESDHTLTLGEAAQAKAWAGGHPCHLQAAGQAWYEARAGRHTSAWAERRFVELKDHTCMVNHSVEARVAPRSGWLRRGLCLVLRDLPIRIGRLAQHLGARLDDVAAWIIGAAVIILILLVLLGVATGGDLLAVIKKGLGL